MIRLIFVCIFLFSCSKTSLDLKKNKCFLDKSSVDKRALNYALIAKSKSFYRCYSNYLRFNPDSDNISSCLKLSVSKRGQVKNVWILTGKEEMPEDLGMCIKQEIWSTNFHGLQLDQAVHLSFPLIFNN